jgi:hypothetical protein
MESIRLEPPSEAGGCEKLAGMNGETSVDDRILMAVASHRRLFPYVVKHLAENRMLKDDQAYVRPADLPPSRELIGIMGEIRDELIEGMQAKEAERQRIRELQVINMTANVTRERRPYFVR